MRAYVLVAVVAMAMLASAGCGDGGPDTDRGESGARAGDDLRGRTFLSTDVEGHDLVEGTELRLTFNDDGTLAASAGCNQFVGELAVDGDVLVVTNLGGTEMGCDADRAAQDEWFTALLSARPTYTLAADGALTLTGNRVTVELLDRELVDPDLPLVGTRWVVDTILEGDAASSVPQDVRAVIEFGDDGRVRGRDGCNDFEAAFVAADEEMTFTGRQGTKTACPSRDVQRLADAVGAATSGRVAFRIEAKRLTLTDRAGRGVSAVGG